MRTQILGCRVVEHLLAPHVPDVPATYLEYGLHRTPELMGGAIQSEIDKQQEPTLFLLGYGLCGNGTAGLRAGRHTLVIPRVDDCISLVLGSYSEYRREHQAEPGTYFLTKGWLECGSGPLNEFQEYSGKYGLETARWLIHEMYQAYTRILLVGMDHTELAKYEPAARRHAEFLGIRYEHRVGANTLMRRLAEKATGPESDDDFVVARPGEVVRQQDFLRW